MTRVRSIAAIAGLLLAAGGLAACGKSSGAPAADAPISGQTITLYNGQHEQTTSALVDAFTKQTGIKVKVRSDDEDVLAQQIQQEGSKSPADVFFTENTPPLARLDEAGLLALVDASTLAAVPAAYNAGDHSWVGVSARVSVIVYNTDKLKPSQLPKSILDLADPKWKGKLGIAPGETDFAPIVTSVAASHGDAAAVTWLKAIKSNAGGNKRLTTRRSSRTSTAAAFSSASSTTTTGTGCRTRSAKPRCTRLSRISRRATMVTFSTCPAPG